MRLAFATLFACCLIGAANAQLFVGYDDTLTSAPTSFYVDVINNTSVPLFSGVTVYGAAADPNAKILYTTNGAELYRAPYGLSLTPTLVGIIRLNGTPASLVGLAFDSQNNKLYGVRNVGGSGVPEGFYEIDLTNGALSAVYQFTTTEADKYDFGGFDYHAANGKFYATNDDSDERGLFEIDLTAKTATKIADYPNGEVDLDGLAVGDGKAFLIPDEPGSIYVYNLATNQYEQNLTAPFTGAKIFSGGAWAPGLLESNNIMFTGTVKLNAYLGTALAIGSLPVKVIVDNNNPVEVALNGINNEGSFTIEIPAAGAHTIQVKARGYLSETITLGQGVNSAVFDGADDSGLAPGDAELSQDNKVDDFDLAAIIFDFGYSGSYPTANGFSDLNGDGRTDDFDLAFVIFGFGKTGN